MVCCDGAEPVVVSHAMECLDKPTVRRAKWLLTKGWKYGSASKASPAAGSVHVTGVSCLSFSSECLIVLYLLFCHKQSNLPCKINS